MRKLTSLKPSTSYQDQATIGQSRAHESAHKQVCGSAPFVDDVLTPHGCLHAAVIVSSISKGKITSLDLSAVKAAPGVVTVLTADAIPGEKDIGTVYKGDPLLTIDDEIRYFGQPIALVIAKTHQQAWQATLHAKVEYQTEEQPITTFSQTRGQAPLLPNHTIGDVVSHEALASQAIYLTGDIHVGGQEHFYLEGQCALAQLTEDRGIFVQSSTQNPTEVQKLIGEVLGIDFNQVVVDMRRMGGGFGGKESQAAQWACLAALGATITNKPVKLRLPRRIDMQATGKRHPFYNQYQISANAKGQISAANIDINGLCGHSADLSDAIVDRAMFHADNAYSLGNACISGNRLKTDTCSHTAFRGFGGPQGMIVIEKVMQQLGLLTGRDALDVRYDNLYRPNRDVTPYGMKVDETQTMLTMMKQLEKSCDYRQRRKTIDKWNQTSPVLKKGLALTPVKFGISFTAQHLNQAGALIHIYTDGSVQVSHGGTEMGQGLHTKVQQIVAQAFGIHPDKILVTSTRTDKVPNTSPTAASSGADLNGMAAYNAAVMIKERLLDVAQRHFATSETLTIEQEEVAYGDKALSWRELVQMAYLNRVSLSATGYYQTPKIGYDRSMGCGRPFYYFSHGVSCSEVTIDTLTGESTIDRVDILHDVGQSINPAIDIGQIEGGFIQGMGWLTSEELVWDTQGKLLSNSPMNYKIPSIGDYPKSLQIDLYTNPNPEQTIYRSKAVGEPPFMHGISVWCAIYDAIAAIGNYRFDPNLHAPATGEQILMACLAVRDAAKQSVMEEAHVEYE